MEDSNTYYSSLFQLFNSIRVISEEFKIAIVNNSELIHVKKKTKLLEAGNRSNKIYFIVKGMSRVYYLDKDGKETTTWILVENDLLISVFSFFTGNPSFEYIETLEDCILIELQREKVDRLYNEFMEFNFIGRKLTEHYYIRNEIQANNLRMLSAKQRYEQVVLQSPNLLNRVPLGYIASFLGISQETLSRIRK
ncbi:CRP-like cAMP-binding protein [Pedobacter cryoconitis]|uniref:CRP-like cAMP-binding protein n=1 Tax=Pedobacter cryoconitis TaxID=188932 RepID=A0A7W9E0X1_9SPHI|nr:Crp/Fnr family transcriptional regulator [Pedobacter cryoconitis]MBB5638496.1 CRP-like cAMP-binding protein [Pedobacter cryoconitis]